MYKLNCLIVCFLPRGTLAPMGQVFRGVRNELFNFIFSAYSAPSLAYSAVKIMGISISSFLPPKGRGFSPMGLGDEILVIFSAADGYRHSAHTFAFAAVKTN